VHQLKLNMTEEYCWHYASTAGGLFVGTTLHSASGTGDTKDEKGRKVELPSGPAIQ